MSNPLRVTVWNEYRHEKTQEAAAKVHPNTEIYGERFDILAPDTLVCVSWFEGGEVFRSGCCYHRGEGKVFCFRPGRETYPIFRRPEVLKVIANAVRWAAPVAGPQVVFGHHPQPLEPV
jgi:trehalose utilization protein